MASYSAAPEDYGERDEDYLSHNYDSYATNQRHLSELHRLSAFQQVTTKVPPSYDGRSSWFAYEDAIDDWCDITELDNDKRGPALRNRLEGEAAIHKRLLDRDRLKDPNNGVKYFKNFLRPLFVKGAANVFLYRFQQFMNIHRGNGDMLRWITRFQLSMQRMQEAWNDTYLPILDPNNAEVRAYIQGLPQEEQQAITPEEAMERANERLRDQHSRTIPITANLVGLVFVSLSDLTQDQRQVLTSLMAHRNRPLVDYRLAELREIYLEVFCTTKTTVDNPLLAPSGQGGRRTFLVIDEGYLDDSEGYWVEDEEDGAEGFLEADEDAFWIYDEENFSWFQRRFQGRKMKRGFKGKRKGKGKGGKGSGGRRFFKKKKGRSHLANDQPQNPDAWQSDWQWQEGSWDDWSWDNTEESYAAKGKGKKGKKGKGKGKGKDGGKDDSKGGHAQIADASQSATQSATTFYVNHSEPSFQDFSFMATEEKNESFIAQPLTPTSMVLDLGCTRAMTSRVAAQDLIKFCDKNPDCGVWYVIKETTSQFTFANSESTKCTQKLVMCMYDRDYVVQSTEFDIVEQGHVPTLMSLPQMRNLRFQFDLSPDKALLSSPVLGLKGMSLRVAPSSHLVLDLLDLCRLMWTVRFDRHKKSSFLTYFSHYEFGFHQQLKGHSSLEEIPVEYGLAVEDEWVLDEARMELARIHKKMRKSKYDPKDTTSPIPLEFLDTNRKTIMEFSKDDMKTENDDWKTSEGPSSKVTKPWKGRTVFKILPGGLESRTAVPVKSFNPNRGKVGSPEDTMVKGRPEDSAKEPGAAGSFPQGKAPVARRMRSKRSEPLGSVPKRNVSPAAPEDDTDLRDLEFSGEEGPAGAPPQKDPSGSPAPEASSLEPRRIALPLPGQEVSRASPQYQRMLEKLNSDVELYKLHVKHYHMSPAQFRRRTSMLGLPGEIYDKYDRIVKGCRVCSTSVPTPPRARVAGLRASSFGDLIFVDHEEIKFGDRAYLALVIIDGASNLLWATALNSLEAPETLGAFRSWTEENNCIPKGIVGDQAFFTEPFMQYYKFHGITPYPCGPRTPWPNRAETAVRLFKRTWSIMAKALADEGYAEKVTVRQAVKKVAWARNCQLTVSGYSPLEIATGRRPPDLFDVENVTPEQLTAKPSDEDRTTLELQRIAMRAHQEARQSLDLRKDLARRVMPSDGPYKKGDRVFVWHKDESKKKSEGIWVRGVVVSQEGAMVLVEIHKAVLRVNQSKVRRDHDPWHDVAIPLKSAEDRSSSQEEVRKEGRSSSYEEALNRIGDRILERAGSNYCFEHEICYHMRTSGKSDFVEIAPQPTGVTACTVHSGFDVSDEVLFGEWSMKKLQSELAGAWKVIEEARPNHIIIHPVLPATWSGRMAKTFWHFCAEVVRYQDDQGSGFFVTCLAPANRGFWLSQCSRSLKWRNSLQFVTFKNDGDQHQGEISLLSNLPEGSFGLLETFPSGYNETESFDPRFTILLTECLVGDGCSDFRQSFLFEDIFEDFDDGALCALCLRSERNHEALPVLPSSEEYSLLQTGFTGKLPQQLRFVAPQRFVTSSLVQALNSVDRLLPGTELEVHTDTSSDAISLRPLIKGVRVLTLPHMEFEFCNVYRGTFGKTLPVVHRHPDAVAILWPKGDTDHVFFLTMSQLLPCIQSMRADVWSMIVFWNESGGTKSRSGPSVTLDYTDQPSPGPAIPPQPPTDEDDVDHPGYEDPQVDMPVDDEDMPSGPAAPEPDLDDSPIELGSGDGPPPQPPGSGAHVPIPDGWDEEGQPEMHPGQPGDDGQGPPPGSGPLGSVPGFGPSPDDPSTPMEYHDEAPPPGGPPDVPGMGPVYQNPDQVLSPPMPWPAPPAPLIPVPIPPHPQFPLPHSLRPPSPRNVSQTRARGVHPEDLPKSKSRMAVGPPVVLLPGQSAGKKPDEDPAPLNEPGSSSAGPSVPGLPVTEGHFPIQQTPSPAPTPEPPVPESDGDSDSDATVDYRDRDSLLALSCGDSDVLIRLPTDFLVPSFVPLDGDGFASWLTKQDKIKAGTLTPDMQRKYAREIRAAKLEEFKSYLDNDAIRLTDRRRLARDVNFLTGRWVLTVKVDKNGYFSKFKARWVCRGFQDKYAWDQQTDSPTATRYGFRLVAQCAANRYWDLFHLDLKTAFLQGEHYNLSSRSVVVQLPPDIGLPPWMVGLCLRPVYGLNDAPRRWWNRLDKFLRSVGMEPTRADRCTYVAYDGIEGKKGKSYLTAGDFSQEKIPESGSTSQEVEPSYLKELAFHAMSCYAYEEMHSTSDHTEERSYLSCKDIAECFNAVSSTTKKMVDYAWRPVTDSKLLGFLGSVACKKRGWFPYENGHALVSHRAKALRSPDPIYKIKDYPYRVSMILRKGTWWIVERAHDLRQDNKPCYLEEEAEVLVSLFLPEKASYKVESLSELSPELVDQLLEHFVDPVQGSPSKGRKTVGVMSLHVDDLIISGTAEFLTWFLKKIREHFTVGHEDKNDLTFTGQRVRWVMDAQGKKKYISIDQKLCVSELEEIVIPKHLKDADVCDKALHTSYRSLLGSINWLQSRTQFQACYQFSRLASASAAPTVAHCKELNKLCRSIRSEDVELRVWPVKGSPRILGIPDAAFRNNSDKSSQRAMTIFIADERVKGRRDTRGSLVFFESTKIKRTTLSTTVAELYALMKCFGTCQMLRGLWKDISGLDAEIHIRTDANNLVSTASTTHSPEQQETIHMIQMLRKEACSGAIADLSHVRTEHCLSDCLTKRSANPRNLLDSVQSGWLKEIDSHPPFRSMLEHKAFLNDWLCKELSAFYSLQLPTLMQERL